MSTLKQKSYVFAASAIAAFTLLTTSTVTHAGVDFSNKNKEGRLLSIEYDPYRSSFIGLFLNKQSLQSLICH